jgi:hypothetical protein
MFSMRWKAALLVGSALLCASSPVLRAQGSAVSTVDPAQREQRLSSRQWSSPGMARLNQNQSWPGTRTVSFGNWHGRYSSLGRKLAPVDVSETRSKRMANLRSGLRRVNSVDAASSRPFNYNVRSPLRNFNKVGNASAMGADERLQGLISTEVEVSREDFATGSKTPALQDINRYNFRKNGANTSGPIPVTPAAGGDQPPSGGQR